MAVARKPSSRPATTGQPAARRLRLTDDEHLDDGLDGTGEPGEEQTRADTPPPTHVATMTRSPWLTRVTRGTWTSREEWEVEGWQPYDPSSEPRAADVPIVRAWVSEDA